MESTLALFDSFNARNLAPQEVASTFVPPDHFRTLVGQHHTLILGPRGSGKTTLLKMMQPEALDAWNVPEAKAIKKHIGYVSVYIATDICWGRQIEHLGHDCLNATQRGLLAIGSFTTQIFRRVIDVMDYVTRSRSAFGLTLDQEVSLARQMVSTLRLETHAATLQTLKYDLGRRLAHIQSIGVREAALGPSGREERLAKDSALTLQFLPVLSNLLDVFNDTVKQPHLRWALLFDELELAPEAIRKYLLAALRSVDERILFKLSLVPFSQDCDRFSSALSAQTGEDFKVLPLWYSHKETGNHFCRELWKSMLKARELPEYSPDEVLGASFFDTESDEWTNLGNAYGPAGRLAKRFRSLASKDASFAQFLAKQHISAADMGKLEGDRRAATVRKATSIVAVRDAYIKQNVDEQVQSALRSRKIATVYAGADSLFAISEGNPRWFKGMIGPLLDNLADKRKRVTPQLQSHQIERATRRFRALLRTIPTPPVKGKQPTRGLITLLDEIGDYFYDALVRKPFTLDPPGSIKVDSRTPPALLQSLQDAVNNGALVSMDDGEQLGLELRGKRLRLSYLLASYYHLTLRVEREISLKSILGYVDVPSDASAGTLPFEDSEQ